MSAPTPNNQATLPLEETTGRKAEMWSSVNIRLDKIIDDGSNPRKDYGDHDGTFAALVDSIRQRGMLQPPVVRPVSGAADCEYHIVLGYRRIAAARALGWESVRCTPMEDCEGKPADYTDEERMIDALVENLQRRELNCIEVAEGVHQLERRGKTQEEIGRWIGRSQGTVSKLSRLLSLPDGVRTHLRLATLSQSHGEELLPLLAESFLPGEIEALADSAAGQGLTANGLRNVVRERIERGKLRQVTIDDVAEQAEHSAPNNEEFDSELDARIARTLAGTKGLDREPKPLPRDDNGLTRKESDKEFASAMAPDPLVPSLSSLPSPVSAPQGQVTGIREEGIDAGTMAWAQSMFGGIQQALDLLERIVGSNSTDATTPGMWFRLEPETALKLLELCHWHLQEHGDMSACEIGFRLNDVVRSFHAAKLEMRAEAEAAKLAISAGFTVFEVPVAKETAPKEEQTQPDGSVLDLYGTAQTTGELVDDMAGRLV